MPPSIRDPDSFSLVALSALDHGFFLRVQEGCRRSGHSIYFYPEGGRRGQNQMCFLFKDISWK